MKNGRGGGGGKKGKENEASGLVIISGKNDLAWLA